MSGLSNIVVSDFVKKMSGNAILDTIFDKPDIIRAFLIKNELFKIKPVFESQFPLARKSYSVLASLKPRSLHSKQNGL